MAMASYAADSETYSTLQETPTAAFVAAAAGLTSDPVSY